MSFQLVLFTESGDSTSIILDPPPFTPFEGSEMLLEQEIEEFLEHDESLNMDLNDDPFSQIFPPKKQINNVESVKTSIEEPPDLELKDLPSHCHTPRRGLDGTRVRRRDLIDHLKYKA
ncbi:hypothetical protein Tco_0361648, partial [Tanacetum coccineum]